MQAGFFISGRPVSRILSMIAHSSIIYLDLLSLTGSCSLPPGSGRAILYPDKIGKFRYIWPFNP